MYWAVYRAYNSCSNLFNSNSHKLSYCTDIQYNGIILALQNGSFLLHKWLLQALNWTALKRDDEKSNTSSSSSLFLPSNCINEGKEKRREETWSKSVASKTCTCNSGHVFHPPDLTPHCLTPWSQKQYLQRRDQADWPEEHIPVGSLSPLQAPVLLSVSEPHWAGLPCPAHELMTRKETAWLKIKLIN